jgi:hypothetical protein
MSTLKTRFLQETGFIYYQHSALMRLIVTKSYQELVVVT